MTPRQAPKYFYMIVGLIAAALLVGGWFVYATRRAKLTALQQTLRAKQTELDNIEPEIARRPQLEAEYSSLRTRLAILEPSLPSYAYVPTLVRQIEGLATETGNKLVSVKPQYARQNAQAKKPEPESDAQGKKDGGETPAVEKPSVPYDSVDIDVEFEGTYWTAIKFLERLQKFPKMIAVNEITIRPSCTPTTAASPDLKAQIAIKAVVIKGEQTWTSDTKS